MTRTENEGLKYWINDLIQSLLITIDLVESVRESMYVEEFGQT